jgi:hypothetical protein
MSDADMIPTDWLGHDDLTDLGLDDDTARRLLRGRTAVHREEVEDLLWRLRRDDGRGL